MKSLIRKSKKEYTAAPPARAARLRVQPQKVAQCCAKVSKFVAGCHD
jgi:hypothetical protein